MAQVTVKDSSQDLCQSFEVPDNGDVLSSGYMGMELKGPSKDPKCCCQTWKIVVTVLVLGATILLGFLIGHYISRNEETTDEKCPILRPQKTLENLDPMDLKSLHENTMYSISGERMAKLLR